ncbi:MAG TPA: hypothetical protein DCW60_00145, partial [Sutterella sp.]|nr:hypothetical protein [Sutterella sp.]
QTGSVRNSYVKNKGSITNTYIRGSLIVNDSTIPDATSVLEGNYVHNQEGGVLYAWFIQGGSTTAGDLSGNYVLNDGTIDFWRLYGAQGEYQLDYVASGNYVSNTATLTGPYGSGYIIGAYIHSGSTEVSGNYVSNSGTISLSSGSGFIQIAGATLQYITATDAPLVSGNYVINTGEMNAYDNGVYGAFHHEDSALEVTGQFVGNYVSNADEEAEMAGAEIAGAYTNASLYTTETAMTNNAVLNAGTMTASIAIYGSNFINMGEDTSVVTSSANHIVNDATGTMTSRMIYGAYSNAGSIIGNYVQNAGDMTASDSVYGALAIGETSFEANENTVTNSGTLTVTDGYIAGAYAMNGIAGMTGNGVTNSGSATFKNLYGAILYVASGTEAADMNENYINNNGALTSTASTGGVYVAYQRTNTSSELPANFTNNSLVNGSEGTISSNAYAVYQLVSNATTASNATISGTSVRNAGTVSKFLYGVWHRATNPTENKVTIEDTSVINSGTTSKDIFGVYLGDNAAVSGTEVINSGSTKTITAVSANTFTDDTANSADISDTTLVNTGSATGILYGVLTSAGSVEKSSIINSGTAPATFVVSATFSNETEVSDSTLVNAESGTINGAAHVVRTWGLTATGNSFYNADSATADTVYVARSLARDVTSGTMNLSNNNAYLTGGTVESLYLAYADNEDYADVSLKDNKLYIAGHPDLSESTLTGVASTNASLDLTDTEIVSGNEIIFGVSKGVTLTEDGFLENTPDIVEPYQGTTVGTIAGFNRLTVKAADWEAPITISRLDALTDADGNYGTIEVDLTSIAFSNADDIAVNDQHDIVTVTTLNGSLTPTATDSNYTVGTTLSGEGEVSVSEDGKTLSYKINTVVGGEVQDQTHTVAMEMSAGTLALAHVSETNAVAVYNLTNSAIVGQQSYAAVGAGASRQNTGSHLTVKSVNISAGVGNNIRGETGLNSLGVAFEGGYGKFKNTFDAGAADAFIGKKGHLNYYGLSALANYKADNGWHAGVLARFGRMESKQNNGLYDFSTLSAYDFKVKSNFAGAELDVGHLFAIDDTYSVDVYAKYIFLYQRGDKFTVGTADVYELDDVTSHRLRLGARLDGKVSPSQVLYMGLGWEHEFDGKSKLKVSNGSSAAYAKPSKVDGGRAFFETGIRIGDEDLAGMHYNFGLKGNYGPDYRALWAEAKVRYVF